MICSHDINKKILLFIPDFPPVWVIRNLFKIRLRPLPLKSAGNTPKRPYGNSALLQPYWFGFDDYSDHDYYVNEYVLRTDYSPYDDPTHTKLPTQIIANIDSAHGWNFFSLFKIRLLDLMLEGLVTGSVILVYKYYSLI